MDADVLRNRAMIYWWHYGERAASPLPHSILLPLGYTQHCVSRHFIQLLGTTLHKRSEVRVQCHEGGLKVKFIMFLLIEWSEYTDSKLGLADRPDRISSSAVEKLSSRHTFTPLQGWSRELRTQTNSISKNKKSPKL